MPYPREPRFDENNLMAEKPLKWSGYGGQGCTREGT